MVAVGLINEGGAVGDAKVGEEVDVEGKKRGLGIRRGGMGEAGGGASVVVGEELLHCAAGDGVGGAFVSKSASR